MMKAFLFFVISFNIIALGNSLNYQHSSGGMKRVAQAAHVVTHAAENLAQARKAVSTDIQDLKILASNFDDHKSQAQGKKSLKMLAENWFSWGPTSLKELTEAKPPVKKSKAKKPKAKGAEKSKAKKPKAKGAEKSKAKKPKAKGAKKSKAKKPKAKKPKAKDAKKSKAKKDDKKEEKKEEEKGAKKEEKKLKDEKKKEKKDEEKQEKKDEEKTPAPAAPAPAGTPAAPAPAGTPAAPAPAGTPAAPAPAGTPAAPVVPAQGAQVAPALSGILAAGPAASPIEINGQPRVSRPITLHLDKNGGLTTISSGRQTNQLLRQINRTNGQIAKLQDLLQAHKEDKSHEISLD
jgi:DNA polymerase III gamma/tau subunit